MEFLKSDARTIALESYSIERGASGEAVTVRAELQISTVTMEPATMRVRVKYQCPDFLNRNELDFARTLLKLLRDRFYEE
jgi:hypothetical protein